MKKLFIFLLLAPLFMACGDDKDEPVPVELEFADYSSLIGQGYSVMMRQLGEPVENFGDYYLYEPNDGKTEMLMCGVNGETQTIYSIMQTFYTKAYKNADVVEYFKGKLNYYGSETGTMYDEDENEVQVTTYLFGNTTIPDDATLLVTVTDNTVTYTDPTNIPEEPETEGLGDIDPIAAVGLFLGQDINDIIDVYGDVFMEMGGMYVASVENDYLMTIALTVTDGAVDSVILLFDEELTDEEIIDYYQQAGYTCTATGTDEEGETIYTFVNSEAGVSISYSAGRGIATTIS